MKYKHILFLVLIGAPLLAQAQNRKPVGYVSGTVTTAGTGLPLQGVSVSTGAFETLTDKNGHYRVGFASPYGTVTVKGTDLTTLSRPLRGDTLVNLRVGGSDVRDLMASDVFTKSTTELSTDEVLGARMGQALRVSSHSAQPAMGSTMLIRGYNSLNANTQPLIIVDGVVWDDQRLVSPLFQGSFFNPLADIDVNDIESVQVLRDASSIYGAKGANGAIYITTRRSHSRVTRIEANLFYGFNLRPKTYRTMDASDYRVYLSEMLKGRSLISDQATQFKGFLGTDPSASDYAMYHNDNDWTDDVYRTGHTSHYGISIDGSDDVAKYAVTLGYVSSDATEKSVDFSRLNARINSSITLSRHFNMDANLYFTYINRNQQDDGVQSATSPTFLSAIKSPFLLPYAYTDDGSQLTHILNDADIFGVSNPVALIDNAKNTDKHYRFGIIAGPLWTINRHFSMDGHFSYSFLSTREHEFLPMTGLAPQVVDGNKWLNTVKDLSFTQNNLFADVFLRYQTLIDRYDIRAFTGYRLEHASIKSSLEEGHNTGNDNVVNMNNSLSFRRLNGENTDWGDMAFMARAQVTYDNRYELWGLLTENASSRFGEHAKGSFRMMGGSWATFPSAGIAWNAGNESFLRSWRIMNRARLYASYGLTGNDDIDGMSRYAYLQGVRYMGNATGLRLSALANEAIKWETTAKLNLGMELSFFQDRLQLGFEWFSHHTKDLLTYTTASLQSGQSPFLTNGGKLKNEGFEVSLEARPVQLKDFGWVTSLGLQHVKNTITALPEGNYTTDVLGGQMLTAVGQPLGVFYGYKTEGVFATTQEAEAAALKKQNSDASYSSFTAGDVHFVDLNGDHIINDADRQVIGDPNPSITGSWVNRLTWKRLQLDIACTYSLGGDIYNYQRQMLESMSDLWNQTNAVVSRWRYEGQTTSVPRAVYGDPMGNSRFSDRWIEDGSYFKVKQIKLSYTLPLNNVYIHGITVWGAVSNVLTLTRYLGIDPEVSIADGALYQGIDNGLLANGRSFYMGMKINL
ncbi:MAG: SusC/RagA family TonB-linked outer membrane protein [Prevotella sp.]